MQQFNFQLSFQLNIPSQSTGRHKPKPLSTEKKVKVPAVIESTSVAVPDVQVCPACSRRGCQLVSHAQYARRKAQLRGKYRIMRSVLTNSKQARSRPRELDAKKIDPFARRPITLTDELEALYSEFWKPWNPKFKGPERHLFPMSRYAGFMEAASTDIALFYGMLALVDTQTSVLRYGKISDRAFNLQSMAIREQMKSMKIEEATDARIGTALCIMSNHGTADSIDAMKPHFAMIQKFVAQRGGVQYLGTRGVLADNIIYADNHIAIQTNQRQRITLPLPPIPPPATVSDAIGEMGQAFEDMARANQISADTLSAARNMCVCVAIYTKACLKTVLEKEGAYFHYLSPVLEYELAELNAKYHDTNTNDNAICSSLLLLNHTILRNYGTPSTLNPVLERRVWHFINCMIRQDTYDKEFLLWLMFNGVVMSARTSSTIFDQALELLPEICKNDLALRWASFEDVQRFLSRYVWSPPVQEGVCRSLFEEADARLRLTSAVHVKHEQD